MTTAPPSLPSRATLWPRLSGERLRLSAVWLAIAATIVVMLVVKPALVAPEQWPILLRQAAPLGVLAIGQTILLIGRGFDLSVGGVVGFVSVLSAGPLAQAQGAGAVIALCLVFGVAVGLVNGAIVSFGRVSPLVATLGTGFVLTGAMLIYTGGAPTGRIPDAIRLLSGGRIFDIPIAVYVWLVLALMAGIMLRRSWFGRYVYAIGSSPRAALHAGVPVAAIEIASYVIASLCAVVGGLLLAGFVGVGTLGAGQELMLNSLAAAVIGGTLLTGGVGGMAGTVGGVILLTTLATLLTGAGAGAAGGSLVQGLVLLAASLLFREARSG
jgi:ribose/xylose/arabinose/galactoside ABC-type transport system permease subunit